MLDDVLLMKELDNQERLLFQTEITGRRKEVTTGVLLAVFLGGLGAHRFYMGQTGAGILYAIFFWTFIPGIVALIEAFLMPQRIRDYNATAGMEVVAKLKALRTQPDEEPTKGDAT